MLTLPSTSTLKLSFAADTTSGGSDGPSYASLIFRTLGPSSLSAAIAAPVDPSAAQGNLFRRGNAQVGSVSVPLQPKKGGKYRWEWDLASSSSSSSSSSSLSAHEDILALAQKGDGRVRAQVYTVSSDGTPELRELGTVYFANEASWNRELGKARKYPRGWEMDRYSPRPELHWTFQPPRRQIGPAKAALGLALVLSPWLLLAALVRVASPSSCIALASRQATNADMPEPRLGNRIRTRSQTSQILPALSVSLPAIAFPFIASLALLEACIAAYWVGAITVWRFMPLVGGIGVVALLSGKTALSDRMERRLKGEANSKPIEKMQ